MPVDGRHCFTSALTELKPLEAYDVYYMTIDGSAHRDGVYAALVAKDSAAPAPAPAVKGCLAFLLKSRQRVPTQHRADGRCLVTLPDTGRLALCRPLLLVLLTRFRLQTPSLLCTQS